MLLTVPGSTTHTAPASVVAENWLVVCFVLLTHPPLQAAASQVKSIIQLQAGSSGTCCCLWGEEAAGFVSPSLPLHPPLSLSYSSWGDRLSGQGLALVPGMGSETCVKMASWNQLEDVYEAHQEILGFCGQMMKASNHYSSAASVVQSGWKCIEQRCLCHLATFYLFFVYFMVFFLFSFSFFLHSLHFFLSLSRHQNSDDKYENFLLADMSTVRWLL